MTLKKNAVPKYGSKNYRGRVAYAVVRINCRDHYLGPYDSIESKAKYYQLIAEWEASGRSRSFGLPQHKRTIKELVADYLRHCETYYGMGLNSEWHRVELAVRPLINLYGRTPAAEFGVVQFKAVGETFVKRGNARVYVNASMKRIVRIFRWAAAEGQIPPFVPVALALVPGLKKGRTPAHETAPIKPVDDAIVDATLPHLSEVVADMVRFHRLTGCRPAEVCRVRPCDIDRSGDVWFFKPPEHKTAYLNRERVIAIGPLAQGVLLPYLLRDAESFCFSPTESEAKRRAAVHAARKTPLMCGNRPGTNRKRRRDIVRRAGDCYDPRSYRKAIYYACKKFGIKSWAPNQLRHSAATEIRKRFGLEAAQVVLGHSAANVTQIYAERDHALAASVAKQVG